MSDKLLSCAFCGKPPVSFPAGEGGKGLMIECMEPNCVHPHVSFYEHDIAIAAWNRRPASPAKVVWEGESEVKKSANPDGGVYADFSKTRWLDIGIYDLRHQLGLKTGKRYRIQITEAPE